MTTQAANTPSTSKSRLFLQCAHCCVPLKDHTRCGTHVHECCTFYAQQCVCCEGLKFQAEYSAPFWNGTTPLLALFGANQRDHLFFLITTHSQLTQQIDVNRISGATYHSVSGSWAPPRFCGWMGQGGDRRNPKSSNIGAPKRIIFMSIYTYIFSYWSAQARS